MEDVDELLRKMGSLIQSAGALSADLADFICAESIPIGEVIADWLSCRGSGKVDLTHRETERLIKPRQASTRVKARRRFTHRELRLLADWQTLEARALTLSINIVLRHSASGKRERILEPSRSPPP